MNGVVKRVFMTFMGVGGVTSWISSIIKRFLHTLLLPYIMMDIHTTDILAFNKQSKGYN